MKNLIPKQQHGNKIWFDTSVRYKNKQNGKGVWKRGNHIIPLGNKIKNKDGSYWQLNSDGTHTVLYTKKGYVNRKLVNDATQKAMKEGSVYDSTTKNGTKIGWRADNSLLSNRDRKMIRQQAQASNVANDTPSNVYNTPTSNWDARGKNIQDIYQYTNWWKNANANIIGNNIDNYNQDSPDVVAAYIQYMKQRKIPYFRNKEISYTPTVYAYTDKQLKEQNQYAYQLSQYGTLHDIIYKKGGPMRLLKELTAKTEKATKNISKITEKSSQKLLQQKPKTPQNKKLTKHVQGEEAVRMFKEYGGIPIPKKSVNGKQLRMYVNEAREKYGLVGNKNITDTEIAQALYKHVKELGKGSAAKNSQGEPQLLFRGDTKSYTQLKDRELDTDYIVMDNGLGTLFTGEFPGYRADYPLRVGSSRYLDGWYLNPETGKWTYRNGGTGTNNNTQKGYQMFYRPFPNKHGELHPAGFIKAASTPEHPNDLNAFVVRTPAVRNSDREISVLNDDLLLRLPTLKTQRYKYNKDEKRIVDTEMTPERQASKEMMDRILGISPEKRQKMTDKSALYEHYYNVLQDAERKQQGLLKSSRIGENGVTSKNSLREEHPYYSYFVVPNFNKQNVKHILPYDLRIPRNWNDPNIFRIIVPTIGITGVVNSNNQSS